MELTACKIFSFIDSKFNCDVIRKLWPEKKQVDFLWNCSRLLDRCICTNEIQPNQIRASTFWLLLPSLEYKSHLVTGQNFSNLSFEVMCLYLFFCTSSLKRFWFPVKCALLLNLRTPAKTMLPNPYRLPVAVCVTSFCFFFDVCFGFILAMYAQNESYAR